MSTCYIDPNPKFKPSIHLITSITRANNAVVTTASDHEYVTGTIVRFSLPTSVRMGQLGNKKATVTAIDATSFSINIDTSRFDAFSIPVAPSWHDNTCALVIPVGEVSSQFTASVQNVD